MNDDALIRLGNLKALNLTAQQLSERVGGRVSYWSDLMRGKKSFGEKAARNIEEKLGIPRGSMDTVDTEQPIPTPQPATPDVLLISDALRVLTKALQKADKNTRIALEPLLASMANAPDEAEEKSQLILMLLVTKDTPTRGPQDSPRSGKLGELIGGSAFKDIGGKHDGRRDRDAATGGKKG
jgi:hypothetical protein